jgi:hypothetical protein
VTGSILIELDHGLSAHIDLTLFCDCAHIIYMACLVAQPIYKNYVVTMTLFLYKSTG